MSKGSTSGRGAWMDSVLANIRELEDIARKIERERCAAEAIIAGHPEIAERMRKTGEAWDAKEKG